jgi:solute carrier family 25 (adenine nucleotide translocator) protein 4/5/6/31
MDCFRHIIKNEGWNSLFRGAGVNVVRGVAGAGVLSGFDKFKQIYIGWRLQYQ